MAPGLAENGKSLPVRCSWQRYRWHTILLPKDHHYHMELVISPFGFFWLAVHGVVPGGSLCFYFHACGEHMHADIIMMLAMHPMQNDMCRQ